jgi:hypothetical protein
LNIKLIIMKRIEENTKNMDIVQLSKIAKRYGFDNVIKFADWVEDNNIGDVLFGLDQEDIEKGKEINKDSLNYKTTMLALEIISMPEMVNEKDIESITNDKWLELSRKVRDNKKINKNKDQSLND